jgi:hypothetical protein
MLSKPVFLMVSRHTHCVQQIVRNFVRGIEQGVADGVVVSGGHVEQTISIDRNSSKNVFPECTLSHVISMSFLKIHQNRLK